MVRGGAMQQQVDGEGLGSDASCVGDVDGGCVSPEVDEWGGVEWDVGAPQGTYELTEEERRLLGLLTPDLTLLTAEGGRQAREGEGGEGGEGVDEGGGGE